VIVVGLTGGIASGKSTVARELARRGARVIDADKLGPRAYESVPRSAPETARSTGPRSAPECSAGPIS
jgi:dephospho-CoA kinase